MNAKLIGRKKKHSVWYTEQAIKEPLKKPILSFISPLLANLKKAFVTV